ATGKPARRQSRLEWAKQRHDLPGRRATMEVPRPGSAARPRLGLAGVVLLALVLSACRTAPLPPPPPADLIVAGTDPTISAASFTLAAGEWKDFEIRVPTAVMAREVIYLELDPSQAGVVELRNASYWHVIASSATSDRFVSGTLTGVPQPPRVAAVEGEAGILPQAVVESRACLGPCVIFEPTAATYYARVVNDTAASLSADLYLYGYDMQDDTEPQNDLRSTAP